MLQFEGFSLVPKWSDPLSCFVTNKLCLNQSDLAFEQFPTYYYLSQGDYVFSSVDLFVCLSFCLFVFEQHTQKAMNGLQRLWRGLEW